MKGQQKLTMSTDSVRESIEEYINRHLVANAQMTVVKWSASAGSYNNGAEIDVIISTVEPIDAQAPDGEV